LSGKTKAITIGLVLAVIGSIICSSYAKDTITNYTGFSILLTGIAACILGIFATTATTLKIRLSQEAPTRIRAKPRILFLSVWASGIGVVLTVIGSIVASAYEKNTIINDTGFGMLLSGICVFVLGFFGIMLATIGTRINQTRSYAGVKIERPRFLFPSILSMGIGTTLTVIGSVISRSYAKESIMNYTGFGMLLSGIAILSLGISGTLVIILKNRWDLNEDHKGENQPRVVLGSIWSIGIGSMLIIIGTLVASSYAKNSLTNYAGFGMLLAGTAVFVYGVFETARISAVDFLSRKRNGTTAKMPSEVWKNLVRTRAVLNIAGIMTAMGLLFFSLWQLDMIVSGPVWWESSPYGQGWSWSGPGAYSNDYFQCFLWKTTIGQAYDTLFLLIFISFIILFASAFFWPRLRTKNEDYSP